MIEKLCEEPVPGTRSPPAHQTPPSAFHRAAERPTDPQLLLPPHFTQALPGSPVLPGGYNHNGSSSCMVPLGQGCHKHRGDWIARAGRPQTLNPASGTAPRRTWQTESRPPMAEPLSEQRPAPPLREPPPAQLPVRPSSEHHGRQPKDSRDPREGSRHLCSLGYPAGPNNR